MKEAREAKVKLKANRRFANIAAIFLIAIGLIFIKNGVEKKDEKDIYYTYQTAKNSTYDVVLMPNNFYDESVLAEGKPYPAQIIEKYDIDFEYKYKASSKAKMSYSYQVKAEIVGQVVDGNNVNQEIWNKKYKITEPTDYQSVEDNNFNLSHNISIPYAHYRNLVKNYENTYNISLDAYLKVNFIVTYNVELPSDSKDKKEKYTKSDTIELRIPLSDITSTVNKNYQPTAGKDFISETDKKDHFITILLVVVGIGEICTGALIIIVNRANKKYTSKELYTRNIEKIIKEYADLIVTVSTEPDLEDKNIMKLDKIEDIIDLAEQNKVNIIHYEEEKNKVSKLYVFTGHVGYVYIVTSREVK